MVNEILKEELASGVHALSIQVVIQSRHPLCCVTFHISYVEKQQILIIILVHFSSVSR